MTEWKEKLISIQGTIQKGNLDGWLLYDFRRNNDLACRILEIPKETLLTRRFFYWIPHRGQPVKIVHRIESHVLAHLPGTINTYSSYEELERSLASILKNQSTIAMEYSPRNALPTVSKVDGGTIDLVRSFGVNVESSADLLQPYTSVWTKEQLRTHLEASNVLQEIVEKMWRLIAKVIKNKELISEFDIQQKILQEFEKAGCLADDPPICAVNANSANPHYLPIKHSSPILRAGDFVLIDVSCKKNIPHAVYADITRVGVIAEKPTKKQQEIFNEVKAGRDVAINFIKERLRLGKLIQGWEVDHICRQSIIKAGYGEYFTHRTGHNIGEKDHGDGANIDSYETKEFRQLLPGTCFSIEPGIYLPEEFGVRLEDDIYLDLDGKNFHITKGMQEEIFCIV